jgi:SH3 domain-containing YSC84-like protein 1
MLDKFKKGAVKAGIQASTFIREGSSRVQSSSQSFAQGFSLPGEAEKAAKILASFLGLFFPSLPGPKPRTDNSPSRSGS